MTLKLAPSLLAADFSRLADEVDDVSRAGADLLHLDIMDGHFVPNLTFGPLVVEALAKRTALPLDAHLMVTDPDTLIPALAAAPVARVAVHVEACTHLQRTLANIRSAGPEAGIAVNPATSLALLDEALPWADFIVVMSVNPGFGGQAFIQESIDKIRRLRDMMAGLPLDISVDGGVDDSNAGALVGAGATTLIAGSSIFGLEDRREAVTRLRAAAADGGSR